MSAGGRLRLARLALGLSQQELARSAGITRQAVAGLESGRFEPSLRVALGLSVTLGQSVEELFGPEPAAKPLEVTTIDEVATGSRVVTARVGDRLVAIPLTGGAASRAGFLPASAQLVGDSAAAPFGPLQPTLVVAGCDPALPLLEGPLRELNPPIGLAWWPCSNGAAVELAQRGLVHAAAVHHERAAPPPVQEEDTEAGVVVGFAAWREGLLLEPGTRAGSLLDVSALGLRIVNREPGAQARRLLDEGLAEEGLEASDLRGYETEARGHLQVAAAIRARLADAGVASEGAALAHGLRFVPWTSELCELRIPTSLIESSEVRALLRVLAGSALRRQLAGLPGYDAAPCGEVIWAH